MNRTNIPLLHITLCLCTAWLLCTTACDDRIETTTVLPGDGETIEVNVRLGFAPEENAADATTDTRTYTEKDKGQAFSAKLQAEADTREATETTEYTTPDKLYGLNYFLYNQAGTSLLASGYQSSAVDIGSELTLSLSSSATNQDDCQLVIIARGTAANTKITANTLVDLQAISFDRDVIDAIPTSGATQDDMNKMPYALHLQHVRVIKDNSTWKLQSPDIEETGAHDVRLMLKRLAAKVTVNWDYGVTINSEKYTLKQLLLQEIPLKFNYIPAPNKDDGSYPDVMSQYTTLTVKDDYNVSGNQKSTYSFWAPANVRADNPAVSSELLRIKDNAPSGSSYLTFEAVNDMDVKKKFRYRIYIGDENPQNFSIKQNTDYIYNIDFTHTGIPTQDRRVTYVDPIPASQNNDHFVPTANCFMVKPGGSFCFDPFTFRSAGKDIDNDVLKGWIEEGNKINASTTYGIQYVKLLWQTKEEGDLGEPVMGIVNSEDDHSNIVEIKAVSGTTPDPAPTAFTAAGQCRIYCRVAPGTTGGNGVIAAYDTEGKILWSWHIWVTDYNPDATGTQGVDDPNKRKLKFSYNNAATNQLPMMDRNLGAMAGYVTVPTTQIEKSKTNGFHYQWGRKDPFPSSYTNNPTITSITLPANATKPIEGLLNLYKADGVTYLPFSLIKSQTTYRMAYQNPQSIYKNSGSGNTDSQWLTPSAKPSNYSQTWGTTKTVHDPSPAGWRVAQISDYLSLCSNKSLTVGSQTLDGLGLNLNNSNSYKTDGGMLLGYDGNGNSTFVRFTGYYRKTTDGGATDKDEFASIGTRCLMWTGSHSNIPNTGGNIKYFGVTVPASGTLTAGITLTGHEREAIPLRCIQEMQ